MTSQALTNDYIVTGGAGGAGGVASAGGGVGTPGQAGGGGAGVGGSGFDLTNLGFIGGGSGGGGGGAGVASDTFHLVNAGTITGGAGGSGGAGGAGVDVFTGTGAFINNSATGTITGGDAPAGRTSGAGVQVRAGGSVDTLSNYGTILPGAGLGNQSYGISNSGTIINLNNAQGGATPLTYTGTLPTNYNVIVSSTSAYGKLTGTSLTGTTTFGVTASSTLVVNTYTAVLSGFATATLANQVGGKVTGSLGGLN